MLLIVLVNSCNNRDKDSSFYIYPSPKLLYFKVIVIGQNLIAKNLITQINCRALEFSLWNSVTLSGINTLL